MYVDIGPFGHKYGLVPNGPREGAGRCGQMRHAQSVYRKRAGRALAASESRESRSVVLVRSDACVSVPCDRPGPALPHSPLAAEAGAKGVHDRLARGPPADLRDTRGVMSEESITPDPVELTRTPYETMDRDWDFDTLAGVFVPDAVWDLSELIDAGDHVIAVARICGCLRGSGDQVEVEDTQVWKMQDGRATEVLAYPTRPEALKAVGLEE